MRSALLIIFSSVVFSLQGQPADLAAGSKAPSFILRDGNTIRSVTMPYMRKIVVMHFWKTGDILCELYNDWLNRLSKKYRYAAFSNAEGFEVIAVAVQDDREAWQRAIAEDSLGAFVNGIASRGFSEEVCVKYGISEVPSLVMINEEGTVISVNPSMMQIENALDERKNFQAVRKPITGQLALSSDRKDALKYSNVYLFTFYGDSVARTRTSERGHFSFDELKLNHDYVLKVDNKVDIITTDPVALYTSSGEFITDGRTRSGGFVFSLHPRVSNKLVPPDSLTMGGLEEIVVIKSLTFSNTGHALTAADKREVQHIADRLHAAPDLKLELVTHTDTRLHPDSALSLSARQANTLQDYFQSKGISPTRIKAIARGNSEPRKYCDGNADCRAEDHRLNRRVEFLVYKD